MKIKIYCLVISLFGYSCLFAQRVSLLAKEKQDSISVVIKNDLQCDTVLFSLYTEFRINNKWVTSNYDLFCNISNPNTSIFIIYPKQEITLTAAIRAPIYTGKKNKNEKSRRSGFKRILLIGNNKMGDEIKYRFFSNTF